MLLRHATLTRHTKGKLPAVWACCPDKTGWAVIHMVKRHGGRVETAVVLEVDVPRSWLRKHRSGLWSCPRDVPPDRIKRALTFQELAATPAA